MVSSLYQGLKSNIFSQGVRKRTPPVIQSYERNEDAASCSYISLLKTILAQSLHDIKHKRKTIYDLKMSIKYISDTLNNYVKKLH